MLVAGLEVSRYLATYLKKYFKSSVPNYLVGLDIDRKVLCYGKNKYDDVVLADIKYLPFRKKSFDLIACIDVLSLKEFDKYRNFIFDSFEKIAKDKIYYHFYNGKIIPMKELLKKYKSVSYIGINEKIRDGYKRRYGKFKISFKRLFNYLNKDEKKVLKVLKSKKEKFLLGSYIIEIDLSKTKA